MLVTSKLLNFGRRDEPITTSHWSKQITCQFSPIKMLSRGTAGEVHKRREGRDNSKDSATRTRGRGKAVGQKKAPQGIVGSVLGVILFLIPLPMEQGMFHSLTPAQ
jgi:hypothetical protein